MRTKEHSCHSVVMRIIVETACKALRTWPVRGVSVSSFTVWFWIQCTSQGETRLLPAHCHDVLMVQRVP